MVTSTVAIPIPTPQQLRWQQDELGVFFHFGINTFFDAEWSDGSLPAAGFNPTQLDADQWVATAAELGARYVILTAKHHDGFCLWPTATTSYSVASSPWRSGEGDVVREVADAARRHGLALGLYLSPWDRNAECYSDPAAYNDFYTQQLTELCTDYGPLNEIWFDGAGSAGRTYDWDRIMGVIRQLQPDALVFNMGDPDIRWVGNEDGLASDPVEYAVASTNLNNYDDDESTLGELRYLPPECDVSIRRGWFWTEADEPKSLDHLLAIYYASVGRGANLLLNLPPDRRGLLPHADVARVRELRAELDSRLSHPMPATLVQMTPQRWRATWAATVEFDHVELREDLRHGQRVNRHRVLVDGQVIAEGQTVGQRRLHAVPAVTASQMEIEVEGPLPSLVSVSVYSTGRRAPGRLEYLTPRVEPEAVGAAPEALL